MIHHLVPSSNPFCGINVYARSLRGRIFWDLFGHGVPSECERLVFHCSFYGYSRIGCPWRLIAKLLYWRAADSRHRLFVVFHELYARQRPWRKGFWLAPMQRFLLRVLISGCDGGLCTTQIHAQWLLGQRLRVFATLPVSSGVGETREPLPLPQRSSNLVVFGGASQRRAVYSALRCVSSVLNCLAVEAIHDIGPPLSSLPFDPQIPLVVHGLLPEAEVADLLSSSLVAAVSYPVVYLAKSSIFAAICAHGALPLVLNSAIDDIPQADGLVVGQTFVTPEWLFVQRCPEMACAAASPIATAAWRWYQPHRLAEQRRIYDLWLGSEAK